MNWNAAQGRRRFQVVLRVNISSLLVVDDLVSSLEGGSIRTKGASSARATLGVSRR